MAVDQKHWKKDRFFGGWLIPCAALLNGEWVGGIASGYDPKKDTEETLAKYAKHFAEHFELNKTDYDKMLIGAECLLYEWDRDYKKLDDKNIWLLQTVFPEITEELKLYNDCNKLVKVAAVRIKKAGFKEPCSRCGGSGHYSRNARGDSTCYKCSGAKYTLPKLSKKKMAEIEKKMSEILAAGSWEDYQKTDEYKQNDYTKKAARV
jgi:hypothetical protein